MGETDFDYQRALSATKKWEKLHKKGCEECYKGERPYKIIGGVERAAILDSTQPDDLVNKLVIVTSNCFFALENKCDEASRRCKLVEDPIKEIKKYLLEKIAEEK